MDAAIRSYRTFSLYPVTYQPSCTLPSPRLKKRHRPFTPIASHVRSLERRIASIGRRALLNEVEVYFEERYQRESLERRGMDPDFNWSTNHFRTAKAITRTVNELVQKVSRENLVFFTFTFERTISSYGEQFKNATSCFQKAARFLKGHFTENLRVLDIHQDGFPHIHGIAITKQPILEGFNPSAYDTYIKRRLDFEKNGMTLAAFRAERLLISTNPALRAMWSEFDSNLKKFGFGPVFDVFPIRKWPYEGLMHDPKEGDEEALRPPSSAVATYLRKCYWRVVPAICASDCNVRAYQASKNLPHKHRAQDMVSKRWVEARDRLVEFFGLNGPKDFKDLLGRQWGITLSNVIDALDTFVKLGDESGVWRRHPLGPWLASALHHMITHDRMLLERAASPFLPGANA